MQYSVIKVKCLKIRANVVPSVYGIRNLNCGFKDFSSRCARDV